MNARNIPNLHSTYKSFIINYIWGSITFLDSYLLMQYHKNVVNVTKMSLMKYRISGFYIAVFVR